MFQEIQDKLCFEEFQRSASRDGGLHRSSDGINCCVGREIDLGPLNHDSKRLLVEKVSSASASIEKADVCHSF